MGTEELRQVSDFGFTLFFAVMVILTVTKTAKHFPKLIEAFHEFTRAIEKNTEVTNRQYNETVSLKEQLLELKKRLESHDMNANDLKRENAEIKESQKEILKLLSDIADIVKK